MLDINSYKLEEKNQILDDSGELFDLFFSENEDMFIFVVFKQDGSQVLVDSDLVYLFDEGSEEEAQAIKALYE